jgi:type II secretory pathway component PulF
MPDFTYVARDFTGNKLNGVLTAPSRRDALAQLNQKGVFPLTVEAARTSVLRRGKRIKTQLMATTYGQLAGLLRSGVPLLKSLQILKDQTSNAALTEVLAAAHRDVEEGSTLAEAMSRHPRAFGEMAVSMVRAGGEGGFLEDALVRVADFTEKQEDLKSRTSGALAYPVFLAVVGTTVITVLIVFFVPKFESLFEQLRQRGELPALTEWLLWLSTTLGRYGWLLVIAMIGAFVAIKRYLATEEGRVRRDQLQLKIPLAGNIFLGLAVARFCRILGTLLKNGVPILKSLEISSTGTGNRVLSTAVQNAAQNISEGQSLAKPLAASGHFPRTVVEMIAVAEESNNLDNVLTDIADNLDRQTWRQLDLMVRLIEPIMLLVLAGVVLMVVIALLLPVLKMSMTI